MEDLAKHLVDVRMLTQGGGSACGVIDVELRDAQTAMLDDLLWGTRIEQLATKDERKAVAAFRFVHVVGGDEDGGASCSEAVNLSRRLTGSTLAVGSSRKRFRVDASVMS